MKAATVFLSVALGLASVAPGARAAESAVQAQARQAAERERITAQIAAIRKRIEAGERSRSGAAAALSRAERALADVNRSLAQLEARRRSGEARAADLDRQRGVRQAEIAAREAMLDRIATALHVDRAPDRLQLALTGRDPDAPLLTETYLIALARAEAESATAAQKSVQSLHAERQKTDDEIRALERQADAQKVARETLAADQSAQKDALARIARQITEQRNTASALQASERRLARVVDELQRVIERQAAERARKREAAAEAARQAARRRAERPPAGKREAPVREEPPPTRIDAVPEPAPSGEFAQLRGRLRMPVRGALTARFGAPRGTGGATWKGVFIRTEEGAEVRAVGGGRVVFADELRGFGNLLIVDHGDQYLSIYGNNQSLSKKTGDAVRPGEVVSTSGNSGGEESSGLYFELRFRGRPFDPMSWTGTR